MFNMLRLLPKAAMQTCDNRSLSDKKEVDSERKWATQFLLAVFAWFGSGSTTQKSCHWSSPNVASA